MFFAKNYISYFFLLNIFAVIQSLVELPIVEDNNIADTEAAIRSTVNNLFGALKIKNVKHKPRLKHFSTIHNFFASITLTDCNNLKQIARLVRVNEIDNSSQHFIALVNEVLNEGDKNKETNDHDVYVTEYIDKFVKQLKYLKESYVSSKNVNINEEVLRYIDGDRKSFMYVNATKGDNLRKRNDSVESNESVLSDNEYWQSSGRRLYHGTRTHIKKFPFVASVQFFLKFQCAGSIIKSDLVITSASCLQLAWNNRFFRENPAFLSVQVGSDFYEGGGDNIAVLEIYFHPRYDPKSLHDNLAIVRLTRKIHFRRKENRVKKIDFDKHPWPLPVNTEKITVIGWGARGMDNIIYNPFRNRLSYSDLSFYPLTYCQDHYTREYVTSKNFCAGFVSKGGGACNRDAGGPGIVDDILMGVISFGSPICGAPDAPTVFTKLGYYTDWITNIINQEVVYIYQPTTKKNTRTLPQSTSQITTTTKVTLLPILFNRITTTTKSVRIKDVDVLRLQDQGFKDFLSTMFDSDEEFKSDLTKEKNDNEQESADKETSNENVVIDSSKIKITRMDPEISGIEMTTAKKAKTHRTRYTNDDTSVETVTRKNNNKIEITEPTKETSNVDNDSDIDGSLEIDIMTLIDNLDLKEFVKPGTNVTGSGDEHHKGRQRNIAIVTSDESSGSSIQISPKQQSVLNFLFLSEESKDKKDADDDDVEGMSIQADDVTNLTFRDKHEKNKRGDMLTESSLYELISLAIDEEAKRIQKKKRYLL